MNAVIITGGLGTRLHPLTHENPKALVKVAGKPIVEHQIDFLRTNNINNILLIVHYQADKVKEYFGDGKKFGVQIEYIEEPTLRGTAGWLALATPIQTDIMVTYGDLLIKMDLQKFISYHRNLPSDNVATIVAQPKDYPLECDHFEIDHTSRITKLLTRPHKNNVVENNLANGSIYLLTSKVNKYIPSQEIISFEKDIFPKIIESKQDNIYAYKTTEYCKDIGTPQRLKEVEEDYLFSRI